MAKDMQVKRFKSSELGETASRRPFYDWKTEYAKCDRSKCRVCQQFIPKASLRLALMLQDCEGYKSTAWTHFDCFWKHEETKKLLSVEEIYGFDKLQPVDKLKISQKFVQFSGNPKRKVVHKTTGKAKKVSSKAVDKNKKIEESSRKLEEESSRKLEEESSRKLEAVTQLKAAPKKSAAKKPLKRLSNVVKPSATNTRMTLRIRK